MSEHHAEEAVRYLDPAVFQSEGYLQEVNRRFLHPLGLALEVRTDEAGHVVAIGGVWDYRDDPEGIIFGDVTPEMVERAHHVQQLWDERPRAARVALIDHFIQPIEGLSSE